MLAYRGQKIDTTGGWYVWQDPRQRRSRVFLNYTDATDAIDEYNDVHGG